MKKDFLLFVVLGIILSLNLAAPIESSPLIQGQSLDVTSEKVYLDPSQIFLSDKGIFIMLDRGLVQVQGIGVDAKGLYADTSYWVCPRCSHENKSGYCDCHNDGCDYTRPEYR